MIFSNTRTFGRSFNRLLLGGGRDKGMTSRWLSSSILSLRRPPRQAESVRSFLGRKPQAVRRVRVGNAMVVVKSRSLTMSAVSSTIEHTTACTPRRRAPFRSRRWFALSNLGSLLIVRAGNSVRPSHLFDHPRRVTTASITLKIPPNRIPLCPIRRNSPTLSARSSPGYYT